MTVFKRQLQDCRFTVVFELKTTVCFAPYYDRLEVSYLERREPMDQPLRVAVCGQSIAWAAVEAALSKSPNIELTRVPDPDLWDNQSAPAVDVLLFEQKAWPAISPANLPEALTAIGLDFSDTNLVAHFSRANTLTRLDDLIRMIRDFDKE